MTDPETAAVRVLLADDEALVRGGVRAILDTDSAISVVAEAADGHEAVDLCRRHRPDVALLDIRMPRLDGLGAAREIIRALPETKIIILTTFGEEDYVTAALHEGAAGFLLKASDPREMITAVHAVMDGAAYLSPRIARLVVNGYRSQPHRPLGGPGDAVQRVSQLTERERDVLAMLAAGHSNAEIGRRLFLVEGTVKGHVSSILLKLAAQNRVQAAIIGYQAGLVE